MNPLPEVHLASNARTVRHFLVSWRGHELFDLDAPYQRGSVWTDDQRRNLIKSLLMGLPVGSILTSQTLFDPEHPDISYRVVDGKQRIEAIRGFFNGDFTIPSEWLSDARRTVPAGQPMTAAELTDEGRRKIENAMIGELAFDAEVERWENPDYDPASMDRWGKPVEGSDPKTRDRWLSRRRTPEEILRAEAELYVLINFGGVPQTDTDRARAQEVADR